MSIFQRNMRNSCMKKKKKNLHGLINCMFRVFLPRKGEGEIWTNNLGFIRCDPQLN